MLIDDDPHSLNSLAAERVEGMLALYQGDLRAIAHELAICNINYDARAEMLAGEVLRLRGELAHALRKLALPGGIPKGYEGEE